MTQLTEKQIVSLFNFTKSKYVRYIDIQHELVDHLATDIEIEMDKNPELSFDKALHNVYAKFPISGFSEYVTQREKAMSRFWFKMIYSQFLKYAGLPVLLALISLTFIQYFLFISLGNSALVIVIVAALLLGYFSVSHLNQTVRSGDKNVDQKYLVVMMFKSWALSFGVGPIITANIFTSGMLSPLTTPSEIHWKAMSFAFLLSLSFVWSIMTYYKFPQLIRKVLNDKYAHLKLSV